MKNQIILETKRLKIKTLRISHINTKYINGLNDPSVNSYLVNARLKKQTRKTVEEFVRANLESSRDLLLGLFIKDTGVLIGTVRIHDVSHFHYSCSVGICIFDKNYWAKGCATEALREVVKFIFGELKLHYIEAGVYKGNKPSVNLFRKVGFKLEASFKNRYRHIDTFKEVLIFGKVNPNFDYSILKCKKK